MAIYRDTEVFCLSITGTENFQYRPLLPLLQSFIANVLKCKAHLKGNFKYLCITMCSLVTSLFSRNYNKAEID